MPAPKIACYLWTAEHQYTLAFIDAQLVIAALNGDQRWMERFEMTLPLGYKETDEPIQFSDILAPIPSGGSIYAN